MEQIRKIIYYKNHFSDFYDTLKNKLKKKIDSVLYLVCIAQIIPKKFFQKIEDTEGLFEIRIEYESNIYRIFCCFDEEKIVVLFNGFQKKTQKTPKQEIEKALKLKEDYFTEKKQITI